MLEKSRDFKKKLKLFVFVYYKKDHFNIFLSSLFLKKIDFEKEKC